MSRQGSGSSAPRSLTLTEELEKLEQSITLTLQEIDHNFSKAHRIVTTSILPLVEQYGEQSKAIWEASQFWKQFFEASANVSLSGYEELAADEDTTAGEETTVHDDENTSAEYTPRPHSRGDETVTTADRTGSTYRGHGGADDSLLTDGDGHGDLSGSTPRPPATKSLAAKPRFADLGSPYEALKRELKAQEGRGNASAATGAGSGDADDDESDTEILLQQHTARLPDMSMTPRASLDPSADSAEAEDEEDAAALSAGRSGRSKDPLLHRVLDKNYRLQATPHKPIGVSPIRWKVSEKEKTKDDKGKKAVPIWEDSPTSSPEMAVPKLRSEAFMSPIRAAYRGRLATTTAAERAPRTPGVSVQTPAATGKTKDVFQGQGRAGKEKDEITWESDEDDEDDALYGGMSPPKTIHFALPPSKLLQTPAREASKRIVDNILLTAGTEPDDSEYSPTVVKMNTDIMDDTF